MSDIQPRVRGVDVLYPRSLKNLTGYLQILVRGRLWLQVMVGMVLGGVGVPAAGIALIMGVDRILDMSRTAINVSGDLVAAGLMDTWVGSKAGLEGEIRTQTEQDGIRRQTGEDVLVAPADAAQ